MHGFDSTVFQECGGIPSLLWPRRVARQGMSGHPESNQGPIFMSASAQQEGAYMPHQESRRLNADSRGRLSAHPER